MSTRRTQWIWMLSGLARSDGRRGRPQARSRSPPRRPPPRRRPSPPRPRPSLTRAGSTPRAPSTSTPVASPRRSPSFERAFAMRSNPVVLKPIAECHERLGHVPEAIAALERYLRELPTASDHAQLEARLASLRQRPARVTVTSVPEGAQITVDGEARPQRTPSDVDIAPGASPHQRDAVGLPRDRARVRHEPRRGALGRRGARARGARPERVRPSARRRATRRRP